MNRELGENTVDRLPQFSIHNSQFPISVSSPPRPSPYDRPGGRRPRRDGSPAASGSATRRTRRDSTIRPLRAGSSAESGSSRSISSGPWRMVGRERCAGVAAAEGAGQAVEQVAQLQHVHDAVKVDLPSRPTALTVAEISADGHVLEEQLVLKDQPHASFFPAADRYSACRAIRARPGKMVPSCAFKIPAIKERMVLLPAPDGPTSAVTPSPASNCASRRNRSDSGAGNESSTAPLACRRETRSFNFRHPGCARPIVSPAPRRFSGSTPPSPFSSPASSSFIYCASSLFLSASVFSFRTFHIAPAQAVSAPFNGKSVLVPDSQLNWTIGCQSGFGWASPICRAAFENGVGMISREIV